MRIFGETRSIREVAIYAISVALALVQLYMIRYVSFPPHVQIAIFLAFVLAITFLVKQSRFWIIDLILIGFSVVPLVYLMVNYTVIVTRPTMSNNTEVVLAIMLLIAVLEASRRCIGPTIAIISLVFLAYAFFGPYLPGLFYHRGYTPVRLASTMYITTNGIFGTPARVASTMIFTFVLFGAMLMHAGVDRFFAKLSRKVAGGLVGGPAKVAVIISALFGTVSGSSAANVVTTGQLTIPMMKKAGYEPEFAGAVEAAASTGGALMPPIMAAGAFIISELTEVPYRDVVVAGVVPALLFYLGIFVSVHFEAVKNSLGVTSIPLAEDERSGKKSLLFDFHLIIPFLILVVLILNYYPVLRAALISILALVVLSVINPACKYGLRNVFDGLAAGAKSCIGVATACACSGVIIGIIGTTGFGLKFSNFILRDGTPFSVAIFLTMVIVIILGMGLPGVAAYIVGISVAGPILTSLGVPKLSAHLFVFYFSNMAVITPPVAITAYAASGIASSDPFKTGIRACLIALPGFIVPYIFIQEPGLLLQGAFLDVLRPIMTAGIGVFALSVGVVGHFATGIRRINRYLLVAGGLFTIAASLVTDAIGLAIIAITLLLNFRNSRKEVIAHGSDNHGENSVSSTGSRR